MAKLTPISESDGRGKLMSVVSLVDQNGQRMSWQSQNGLMYKYLVEFENGDKGTAMSPKTENPWPAGKEYIYHTKTYQNEKGTWVNISGIKDPNQQSGNKRKYTPQDTEKIINQVCIESAAIIAPSFEPEINWRQLLEPLQNWMKTKVFTEKKNSIEIGAAMRRAAIIIEKSNKTLQGTNPIIELAEEIYNIIQETSWTDNLQQNDSQQSGPGNQQQNPQQNPPASQPQNPPQTNNPPGTGRLY